MAGIRSDIGNKTYQTMRRQICLKTTEMHTGGEPLRIVESGYPKLLGKTLLEKRLYAELELDVYRRLLMHEPRGHRDMYGAVLAEPDDPSADLAVLFLHNSGYSTMCGHAVIALGRYAVDRGIVKKISPETEVTIQCPCGIVKAYVSYDTETNTTGTVRFRSVPAFPFAEGVEIDVQNYGQVKVDISYGGTFYAVADATKLNLEICQSQTSKIIDAANKISEEVRRTIKLTHPDSEDLAFLYGTILTDGRDEHSEKPTANICVFADSQVDRCPTGSGVTARIALQYSRKQISLNQTRIFQAGATGTTFTGKAVMDVTCGDHSAVIVEVAGKAHYTGTCVFTVEDDDELGNGFLLK